MIIVLLGPPGAGKGTQAKQIQDRYRVAHISTGDLFRAAQKDNSELGRSVKQYLESGQLVPDEVTTAMVAKRVEQPDCMNGFMLDGFPRTLPQAAALDKMLIGIGRKLDAVAYFDVTEATAVERLGGRVSCAKCGAGYHEKFMAPRVAGKCDKCGGELRKRADDSAETIRERLAVYERQTSALIDEYDRRGLLCRVDANRTPEDVTTAVLGALDKIALEAR